MKNNFTSNYAKYLCGIITEEKFYETLNDNQSTRTGEFAGSPVTLTDQDPNHQEKMQSRFDSAIRGLQSFLHLHDDELIGLHQFDQMNVRILGDGSFPKAQYKAYFSRTGQFNGFMEFIKAVNSVVLGQPVYEDLLSILERLNKDKYKDLIAELNDRYQHFIKNNREKKQPFGDDNLPKLIDDIINYRPKS
jgi:hypothetical protein